MKNLLIGITFLLIAGACWYMAWSSDPAKIENSVNSHLEQSVVIEGNGRFVLETVIYYKETAVIWLRVTEAPRVNLYRELFPNRKTSWEAPVIDDSVKHAQWNYADSIRLIIEKKLTPYTP